MQASEHELTQPLGTVRAIKLNTRALWCSRLQCVRGMIEISLVVVVDVAMLMIRGPVNNFATDAVIRSFGDDDITSTLK